MDLTPTQARQALMGLRFALGGAAVLAPRPTGKLFGIDPDDNPAGPFLGRLYGFRNLAIATLLAAGDDREVDRWLSYGIAIDAADAAAAVAAGLRGYLPRRAAVMAALTAGAAVALGIIAREG